VAGSCAISTGYRCRSVGRQKTLGTVAETHKATNYSTNGSLQMSGALAEFLRSYPAFATTGALDVLRATDYARLDQQGHTYLDFTGGGLYAESQLRQHQEMLLGGLWGNPRSQHQPSRAMSECIEAARAHVLEFFHASPVEYEVIFTPNATSALRLVGESYPFGPGGQYLLTSDNHDSVNGIREFARAKGAGVSYVALRSPELRVPSEALTRYFSHSVPSGHPRSGPLADGPRLCSSGENNLFAYPAQSNFSGVQHPPEWIPQAHDAGWDVLLDAAAFVPTNRLDLSSWHPDYVALSFYKMFGYPTGIGALLVRHLALAKLRRPWYAGRTLPILPGPSARTAGGGLCPTAGGAGFEDGTLDFLGIPAVGIGLRYITSIGMDAIHTRVMCLTGWLLEALAALRHGNGRPVVCIYGPEDTRSRGATIAMNFTDPRGELVDSGLVQRCASSAGISLRSGCQCNPGARDAALAPSEAPMVAPSTGKEQMGAEQFPEAIDGKKAGVLRVSLGLASTFADVYRFWEFARIFGDTARTTTSHPSSHVNRRRAGWPTTPVH
jgi:molybdenum cofactor sulfurtransferase